MKLFTVTNKLTQLLNHVNKFDMTNEEIEGFLDFILLPPSDFRDLFKKSCFELRHRFKFNLNLDLESKKIIVIDLEVAWDELSNTWLKYTYTCDIQHENLDFLNSFCDRYYKNGQEA